MNLYPKEWMVTEMTKDDLNTYDLSQLRSVEPWWKIVMANKAMLPLLYQMFPTSKYLLPAFFSYDPKSSVIDYKEIVAKPIFGREGTGVKFGMDYSSATSFSNEIS